MGVMFDEVMIEFEIGKFCMCWELLKGKFESIVILNFGCLLFYVFEVVEVIDVIVIDMCFIKLLDGDVVLKVVSEYSVFIMLEDGCIMGGVGSVVFEYL